ncbi:hypothetical protein EVG20_g6858 [Dentipellis fragilis]|uniref:Deoxyribonuclease NucA/NucB domain-containing protein n=1 Tax=Dentipellis fragilis TaxID=205917 RepID=A0A4Y9YJK0_9AGAM|nr:hypothetical protein EVG20_g6858 [Dentipellis fragilis]
MEASHSGPDLLCTYISRHLYSRLRRPYTLAILALYPRLAMARTTSFASLLSLVLLLAPSLLSASGPLLVSATVAEPALSIPGGGADAVNLSIRKVSAPKKSPTTLAKSATPAKASVKTSATPAKASSAAPVRASLAKATSAVKTSSAAPKASTASRAIATSSKAVASSSSSVKASSFVGTGASASKSAIASGPSVSATSSAACALKRAGTAGVTAAADCGTCDPCDDSCDSNTHDFITRRRRTVQEVADAAGMRVVYGNDTTPFLPDEDMRLRVIAGRANVQLEFDCSATSNIPNVCQNMCYGINCRGHASTLTRNSVGDACKAARKNNSCGSLKPNRCSAKTGFAAGHKCDEYPFASTLEGQSAGTGGTNSAVTRCVPGVENDRQGQKLSTLYKKINNGDTYDVILDFGNGQAGTGYCAPNAASATCATLVDSQQDN